MSVSRQEESRTPAERSNQKARTRTALLRAAAELVAEGRAPSMPEAADRALVSVATAYRYFSSAEDLWWEASNHALNEEGIVRRAAEQVEAAGPDPGARLETLIRSIGFHMLDHQLPYRQIARVALDQWFGQAAAPTSERVPVRQGRRNEQIRHAIAPLRERLSEPDLDDLAHALGLLVGSEAMISLTDAVGLDVPTAKKTLLNASRWLLAGALAELQDREDPADPAPGSSQPA